MIMFLRQFLIFIASYSLLNYLYFLIPDQIYSEVIYHYGLVLLCADLINFVVPQEQASAVGNHLLSVHADLQIIRGCDSAGVVFLLVSAVLAFQAGWRQKLLGLGLGMALVISLNILRVSGLYFLMAYHRSWFEWMHLYLAPGLMLLATLLFFAWWAISCRDVAESA